MKPVSHKEFTSIMEDFAKESFDTIEVNDKELIELHKKSYLLGADRAYLVLSMSFGMPVKE